MYSIFPRRRVGGSQVQSVSSEIRGIEYVQVPATFGGVCRLAGMSSNENAGEIPYRREVRDGGGPTGDSGRDRPGSIGW